MNLSIITLNIPDNDLHEICILLEQKEIKRLQIRKKYIPYSSKNIKIKQDYYNK